MEVAGLVLAVGPYIVQAYQGISQLYRLFSDIRDFKTQLDLFRCQLLSQKTRLHNECTLLFGNEFDSEETTAMLKDWKHPKWNDAAFQSKFVNHLGEAFEPTLAPFKLICATLHELERELKKFTKLSTNDRPDLENTSSSGSNGDNPDAGSSKAPRKVLKSTVAVFKKTEWSLHKKQLQGLQKSLREQIDDLLHLREQRTQLKKFRVPSPKHCHAVERKEIAAISAARAASRRLYDAVESVANCPCHRIDFQLRGGPIQDSSKTSSETSEILFHLLVAPLTDNNTCTCVTIRPEREGPAVLMAQASGVAPIASNQVPRCVGQDIMPDNVATTIQSRTIKRKTTRVRFDMIDTEGKKIKVDAEDSSGQHTSVLSNSQINDIKGTINNLCALLGKYIDAPPPVPTTISLGTYLGLLPTIENYRHVLYRERGIPANLRVSLPQLFERANSSSTKKHFIWPCKWRYKLAYTLASSLLYQSFWFGETWRSDDIHFLVTSQQQFDEKSVENPHISVRFRSPLRTGGICLAPREWSFSLAIALLEIGYGNRLRDLYAENEIATYGDSIRLNWDHLKEFYGAKKFVTLVAGEMGGRYSKVVQRCFNGDFGIDDEDLTGPDMQEAFYNRVVCELRECLLKFEDV